jgi:hypothetical protein
VPNSGNGGSSPVQTESAGSSGIVMLRVRVAA